MGASVLGKSVTSQFQYGVRTYCETIDLGTGTTTSAGGWGATDIGGGGLARARRKERKADDTLIDATVLAAERRHRQHRFLGRLLGQANALLLEVDEVLLLKIHREEEGGAGGRQRETGKLSGAGAISDAPPSFISLR